MSLIKNALIKLKLKYSQWKRRKKLLHTDFCIISNNCWAATAVYQPFGLKYNTPTVGLFFMDEDYIRFLENLDYYLNSGLKFITPTKSKYFDKISSNGTKPVTYPIALLGGDVEVHFLHYHSEKEAAEKWKRRVKRINYDRLLVKMSLRDSGYDVDEMLRRFIALPFSHKICFTADKEDLANGIIPIPELSRLNLVGGDETDSTLRHVDIARILNSMN